MQAVKGSLATLPGWRDFERAVAAVFEDIPSENKDVMDVRIPDSTRPGVSFGLSCKMRRELDRVKRDGRVTIELSNSNRAFWRRLGRDGITAENYRGYASEVGGALVRLVGEWHSAVSIVSNGDVDLVGSCYLTLMWSNSGEYQLHQFPIELPNPDEISWYCPVIESKSGSRLSNAIRGDDDAGTIFEWYGRSGGQLKYYPKATCAVWASEIFRLEPLPPDTPHGLVSRAQSYFTNLWPLTAEREYE